jgi:pyruvate/2-oxoglutarate dehydrogenase complex dihydrolipoamide dehydrogenase (E3) component
VDPPKSTARSPEQPGFRQEAGGSPVGTEESIGRDANGLIVRVGGDDLRPQLVLHAAGRTANVEGLGVAGAGVEVDERGRVLVDQSFRTTADGI